MLFSWLVFANIWFLWNPFVFATLIDSHHLKRATNIWHSTIDLFVYKTSNGLTRRNAPIESTFGLWGSNGHPSINAVSWATVPLRLFIEFPSLVSDASNPELHKSSGQLSFIQSVHYETHNRAGVDRELACWWVRAEDTREQWFELGHKRVHSAIESHHSTAYVSFDDSPKTSDLIFLPSSFGDASDRKVEVPNTYDLANVRLLRAIGVRRAAIGSDQYFLIGSNKRNRGPMRDGLREKPSKRQNEYSRQPKWIRHRYALTTICWVDKADGPETCSVSSMDVDISQDAKTWFHALGTWCPDGLPEWKGSI